MARHTAKSHKIRKVEILVIQTGIFGADMQISLINDGPFTIVLDSEMLA